MIISCINCYKKFEINSDLIPENGRLLQCSICNHQWFFKKKLPLENINQNETDDKPIISDILTDKKIESEINLNPIQKKTSEGQNIENLSKELDEKENTIPIDTAIQSNKKSIHFDSISDKVCFLKDSKKKKRIQLEKISIGSISSRC